jgi:NAD(P)H-nitrite reductase large subunit
MMPTTGKQVGNPGDNAVQIQGGGEMRVNAGANITGDDSEFKTKVSGVTLNAFGTQLFSMGENGTECKYSYEVVSCRNEIKRTCSKILFRDGKIAGAMLVGDVSATAKLIAAVTSGYDKTKVEDSGLI